MPMGGIPQLSYLHWIGFHLRGSWPVKVKSTLNSPKEDMYCTCSCTCTTRLDILHTGIPRLARFWWQEKNRVRWNSCYASQNGTFFYCQMPGQMTLLYTNVVSYKTLLLTITCILYHFCKVENIFGKKIPKRFA